MKTNQMAPSTAAITIRRSRISTSQSYRRRPVVILGMLFGAGAEPRPVVMLGALESPPEREVEMLGADALAPPPIRGPSGLTGLICPLLTLASKPWSPRRNTWLTSPFNNI